jgi:diguanylate cyclase (GGDEF)-like protein
VTGPPRLSGFNRVWLLTALVIPGAVFSALAVWEIGTPRPPIELHWLFFAGLFYLAEITVVHIKFRRDAHSFSMSEMPLVLAVFFLSPPLILAAQLIGSALALGLTRRQRPVKLVFNLAQLSLQTSVMIGVFWMIVGGSDPLGSRGFVAVAAGIAATLVTSNVLISAAIRMSGGSLSELERRTMYALTVGAGFMNAALGLVAATVLWARPQTAWIAAVPSAVLFFAYRAYLSQRLERERLQSLYEVSGELHRLPKIEDALAAAVDRARIMFDAERARIVLHPDGVDAPGFLTVSQLDHDTEVMVPAPVADDEIRAVSRHGEGHLVRAGGRVVGMIVPIASPGSGTLEVMSPLSDIGSFGERDLQLLATLAGHVGVSLENGRLEESLVKLTELQDQLRHQALHDALTGLANRNLLLERLAAVTSAAATPASVLFLDLDDFKAVNDGHGHETGDRLLIHVARRLESCCRPGDTVARLGGDEFALLLVDMASPDDAVTVAKRIIAALARPFDLDGVSIETHASIGVAMIEPGSQPDDVLKEADEAMYVAKGEGKGTYRVHSPGLCSTHSRELGAVTELRAAIRAGQLELHHQPILELSSGRIAGVEALVRWRHPVRGLIGPDDFVPLAERRQVIAEIGDWVLRNAADTLQRLHRTFPHATPTMSINLSPTELTRTGLVRTVLDVLAARHLDPALLQIEITEGALMSGGTEVLDELRRHGVRVAIDDFGTGYSSLAYLDRLPVDTIKLDRSFVERVTDPRVRRLVELMLGIGATMGFATVAEGIETSDQLLTLERLGCTLGQGYHLALPLPEPELMELLAAERTPARLRLA